MYSVIIIKINYLLFFDKNGDTASTLAKKKAGDFYKKILNIIDQIDNGNNIIW